MTSPIQVPIINTSPPAALPVKPAVKPEKSGEFEQILKQKTNEIKQGESVSVQSDQVVKDQPQNKIRTEEKSLKEESKHEIEKEGKPEASENKDEKSAEASSQSQPANALMQSATVSAIALIPVPVEVTEPSSGKSIESGVEAAPLVVSGSSKMDESAPATVIVAQNVLTKGAQVNITQTGKSSSEIQGDQKDSHPVEDIMQFADPVVDPSSQADPKQEVVLKSQDKSNTGQPLPQKAGEAFKDVLGQSVTDLTAQAAAPEQSGTVKKSDINVPVEDGQNVKDSGEITSKASIKVASPLNVGPQEDVKVDTRVQAGEKVDFRSTPEVQSSADIQVKNIKNEGKPEKILDTQPPPEASDTASPVSSPGMVNEGIRIDPFTGKINGPARLAEAQTNEILRQISRQVAGSSGTGSQSIRIQLHPDDLGQIDLRISTSALGTHVTLIPDQSSTGKLLETHIAQLKQTLTDAGVQMANVHVGQQSQQQSFRDPQYGQNTARQNSNYNPVTQPGVDEISSLRSQSKSTLVDYRI